MLRVRGIYSTSLVGLLDELGFTFSDITEKVKERIGHARSSKEPVAVTVKDLEDHKGIVVVGDSETVRLVAYGLAAVIPESFVVYVESGPYTSMAVRVLERVGEGLYRVELPSGKKGLLRTRRPVDAGMITVAYVVRPDPAEPFLSEGLAVVGRYARLVEQEKHSVSEHIWDQGRAAELLSLAQMLVPEGWGVKFRSSAGKAPLVEVMSEVKHLIERVAELKRKASKLEEPSHLASGEAIAFVHFSPTASVVLDRVRSRYFTTIPLHHLLKSTGSREVSERVDKLEAEGGCDKNTSFMLYADQLNRVLQAGTVTLVHRKLLGKHHTWVASATVSAEGFLLLSRSVRTEGVYDGVGIPKNVGDSILSVTWPLSRTVAHFYFDSKGKHKGAYININTPLDFFVEPRPTLTYIDLQVDVVRVNDKVRVIDEDEFQMLVSEGVIFERDASRYRCLARESANILARTTEPTDVAWALLEAQGKCFKGESVEEVAAALRRLRGLSDGRAFRALEDEVH
ncbi:MAG: DUF402 domain-containing protein [Thermofilum sp.]